MIIKLVIIYGNGNSDDNNDDTNYYNRNYLLSY